MPYGNPDNKDIMAALDKMQKQFDEMKRQNDELKRKFDEMQESHRLFSPEHIAQAIGYMQIKDDLKAIKKTLTDLSQHAGIN